jgi:hypothetical protein
MVELEHDEIRLTAIDARVLGHIGEQTDPVLVLQYSTLVLDTLDLLSPMPQIPLRLICAFAVPTPWLQPSARTILDAELV